MVGQDVLEDLGVVRGGVGHFFYGWFWFGGMLGDWFMEEIG